MRRVILALPSAVLLVSTLLALTGVTTPRPAHGDVECSCVVYVQNKLGIPGGCGCAQNYGPCLQAGGYVQIANPTPGAVVILQGGVLGALEGCGHMGIILQVESVNGGSDWHLLMRSAAWGGTDGDSPDAGCSNVSNNWLGPYPKGLSGVTYWSNNPPTPTPTPTPTPACGNTTDSLQPVVRMAVATPSENDIPWGWQWTGMHSSSRLALGDYDGDGKTDRAIVASDGRWYILLSSTGSAPPDIPWGWQWSGMDSSSRLALGDYDGDGKTDRAIVTSDSRWYILLSSTGSAPPDIPWGWQWSGMTPSFRLALGDYDGDGKTDRAVVDPNTAQWYVLSSSTGSAPPDIPWGWQWPGMSPSDRLVLGDYDGDGKTDRAMVAASDSKWYILSSSTGSAPPDIPWGWQWSGMTPSFCLALGNYDGDGNTDRAVVDPNTGQWYILGSFVFSPSPTPTPTQTPAPVGGIAEYPQLESGSPKGADGSSVPNAFAVAGIAAGGAVLLMVGGWYARRRWLCRRA